MGHDQICVLEALRNRLRCKEIWVVGANRYRNPDEDLPADFEARRPAYYQALNLPLEAERFITALQEDMRAALGALDAGLPDNRLVQITGKRGGSITVTPFEPQPEPPNLSALKTAITATWPMTNLLDMLKETDLRLGFSGSRQELCVAVRHRRTNRKLDVGIPYLPWDSITSSRRETPDGQRRQSAAISRSAASCRRAGDGQNGWLILT